MIAMFGLENVLQAGQKAGKVFREDDAGSLLRLNRLPVEEIESRAKAKGLWNSKEEGKTPVSGDLVTFNVGKDQSSPHVGYVLNTKGDGSVCVRSESPLRGGKAQDRPDNAIDEEFTLKSSEIRGTISQPTTPGNVAASVIEDVFPPLGLLRAHQNFQSIVTQLLDPGVKVKGANP